MFVVRGVFAFKWCGCIIQTGWIIQDVDGCGLCFIFSIISIHMDPLCSVKCKIWIYCICTVWNHKCWMTLHTYIHMMYQSCVLCPMLLIFRIPVNLWTSELWHSIVFYWFFTWSLYSVLQYCRNLDRY